MVFSIASNAQLLGIQRNIGIANNDMARSMARLSSGYRINTGADSPADLVISEQLRAEAEGIQNSIRNNRTAMNYLDIEEGALSNMSEILKKMKRLAIQAANTGINSPDQLAAFQAEMDYAVQGLARTANPLTRSASFRFDLMAKQFDVANDKKKSLEEAMDEQYPRSENDSFIDFGILGEGLAEGEGTPVDAEFTPLDLEQLDPEARAKLKDMIDKRAGADVKKLNLLDNGVEKAPIPRYSLENLMSGQAASLANDPVAAMKIIDEAIKSVTHARAMLGAQRNAQQSNENIMINRLENIVKTESHIRDADMATEVVAMTRAKILAQVGVGLLSQANQHRQSVLALLG